MRSQRVLHDWETEQQKDNFKKLILECPITYFTALYFIYLFKVVALYLKQQMNFDLPAGMDQVSVRDQTQAITAQP